MNFSDEKTVSVIIPIYNGERHIESCVSCLERQNYKNLQIVFVNDGSTDSSAKLLTEYSSRSSYSVCIVDQSNSGQGEARNRGIFEASGDYIMFADQDDVMEPDLIEQLLECILKNDSDVAISGYKMVDESLTALSTVVLKDTPWSKYMNICPWAKLYKTSFIKKHGFCFAPLPLGEDIFFSSCIYACTEAVAITEYIGYWWVQNSTSFSHTAHKTLSKETNLLLLFERLRLIETNKSDLFINNPLFQYFIIKTAIYNILDTYKYSEWIAVKQNNKSIWNWVKKYCPNYKRNRYLSFSGPEGERKNVALIIKFYMMMHSLKLDSLILKVFRIAK